MNDCVCAMRMELVRNRRAQSFGPTGDQNHFVVQSHVAHNVTMHFDSPTLPPLTADEQLHSDQLCAVIRAEIVQNGNWIGFDRYMELALYAPGLGYYNAGAHKLGAGGDFTTAAEISPLFSQCMANQCIEVLTSLNGGGVLELGAGSGIMAAEMLLHMESMAALPSQYFILEVSADLQQRQRELLRARVPHLINRIKWLTQLPQSFVGIMVANEVLDALPIKRFSFVNGQVHELGVSVTDSRLIWQTRPLSASINTLIDDIAAEGGISFNDGYASEINQLLPSWIKALSDCMSRGVMLFVDYGLPRRQYYSVDRSSGTLNCFYKHRQHDNPFVNAGIQDITAWVDFTALAEAGTNADLQLSGYSTQAHFLIGAGIEALLRDLMNRDGISDKQRWHLSQQVQKLMLPDGMGEAFKAMAFNKNCDVQLSGFAFRDLRHLL